MRLMIIDPSLSLSISFGSFPLFGMKFIGSPKSQHTPNRSSRLLIKIVVFLRSLAHLKTKLWVCYLSLETCSLISYAIIRYVYVYVQTYIPHPFTDHQ